MKLTDLRLVDEDGSPCILDAANLRGMVVDLLDEYRVAGEHHLFLDCLMPDVFRDRRSGEPVEVTLGQALDLIAGREA